MNSTMALEDLLYLEGFGTRRVCAGLVQQGLVEIAVSEQGGSFVWQVCRDAASPVRREDLLLRVQGQPWTCHERACVLLHKPAGFECSQRPSAWPSVYTLLPAPLRQRPRRGGVPGVQAVGRLDQDTTGLLVLTDDGAMLHRLGSPRRHVAKVYEVTLRYPAEAGFVARLLEGVVLDDDPQPVQAQAAELTATRHLHLTLTSGKYHQVKRMVAAAGNRVEALHRSRMGGLDLPPALQPGQWCWLDDAQQRLLEA